jgi:hypothetical protein
LMGDRAMRRTAIATLTAAALLFGACRDRQFRTPHIRGPPQVLAWVPPREGYSAR